MTQPWGETPEDNIRRGMEFVRHHSPILNDYHQGGRITVNKPKQPTQLDRVSVAVNVTANTLGVSAWVWLGDWRYALTSLLAGASVATVSKALRERRKKA
ncbi:hypothetical protein GCM10012275_28640 [Longimycelium tulufanense]|uniref:Uncharacterized protein n=1 Tax=Longimycelium tulufanense TaxID=907463 RepID=A0A8J3FU61_9PSEU|nr:hypothetical protein [Longimycelium tulufanense]GGM55812.1 hypothetical protein GCM10012275_28640 [Longimycelium tulufanense]